ncbi:hypothetical protein [Bradyrhizobium sp. LTSPM299]|jgi:hypothetical protein|uniref:hypothetical protein n=1 Tax=Bradyrhizobium sp. LTSPM299 TaxID=1619233 RepID=UPI000A402DA6|nr:hypothetical protein [Bradyrhizobium sp. LTSPM299]
MKSDMRHKGLLLGGAAKAVGLGWPEIDGDQPHGGQPFPWVPKPETSAMVSASIY